MRNKIKEYLDSQSVTDLSGNSQKSYKIAMIHLERFSKLRKIQSPYHLSLQPALYMDDFVKFLRRKAVGGTSIRQYLTCIKIFLKWDGHPIQYTFKMSNTEKKIQKLRNMARWFSDEDVACCLAHEFKECGRPTTRLQNRALLRVLVETGARVAEIAGLTWNNIDLGKRVLYITDSKTEPRPAFFSRKTAELLTQLKRLKWGEVNRTFPELATCTKIIMDMLTILKLKRPADQRGPHTFRHYCATVLWDRGMTIEDVAVLLGDKPETIQKNYIHPTPEMMRRKMEAVINWDEM